MRFPQCLLSAVLVGLLGCDQQPRVAQTLPPIVGAWLVKSPEAPFPLHVFVFHADGTIVQSNPEAGNPKTSDSNLMGQWVADGDGIKGKLVEVSADRNTHKFVSRGEISIAVTVRGNEFHGKANAVFYGPGEQIVGGPVAATLEGHRIVP